MLKLIYLAAVTASAASAAAGQSPYPHRSGAEKFSCRPTGLPHFVGQLPNASMARQVLTVSGAKKLRWVAAGQAVTGDARKDRVTVHLDAQGRVASAVCV